MPDRFAVSGILLLLVLSLLAGCAGRAYRAARGEDTVAAYHRFLQQHPESAWSDQARARLEMARIRHKPTREAYRAFQREFTDPALLAELDPHVEEAFYRHARSVGSAEAYRTFLEDFPAGRFAARARGNAQYLAQGGFGSDPQALARFAAEHPESDFAAEARRSAEAVARLGESGFRRVGIVVEVAPGSPGAERVRRAFHERAAAAYTRAGLQAVVLADPSRAGEAGVSALLRMRHEEREVGSQLDNGTVTEPAVVARTEIVLQRAGQGGPVWSDVIEHRVPLSARRPGESVLFGPGMQASYWGELEGVFFVPVAHWDNQVTVRPAQSFARPPVAVEVAGSRAVVLFREGDFEIYDLGDPARPVRLGEHRRERDLSRFDGASLHGDTVAVYGEDGVELVRLDGEGTRRAVDFGRDVVGSAVDVEPIGGVWVAATNRGLLELGADASAVHNLLPRNIPGLARLGDRVVFTDGTSLYVASLPLLRQGRVESELRLGSGFAPARVRVYGSTAVVLGARDAVWVDLRQPGAPRLLSRVNGSESGRVRDAAVVGGRLFLLGRRGLQVADRSGERIVDSIDVEARQRLDASGRHLVMIGERTLQVVDTTPYGVSSAASPAAR